MTVAIGARQPRTGNTYRAVREPGAPAAGRPWLVAGPDAVVAGVDSCGASSVEAVAAADVAGRTGGSVAVEQPAKVEAASNTAASSTAMTRRRGTRNLLSSRPILARRSVGGGSACNLVVPPRRGEPARGAPRHRHRGQPRRHLSPRSTRQRTSNRVGIRSARAGRPCHSVACWPNIAGGCRQKGRPGS